MTDQKQDPNLATIVHTSQGNYPVIVGRDVIDDLGLELQKTGQQGRAFIVADEVMFLHRGRLLEHGPAEDFFARPQSEAAQAFLAGDLFW